MLSHYQSLFNFKYFLVYLLYNVKYWFDVNLNVNVVEWSSLVDSETFLLFYIYKLKLHNTSYVPTTMSCGQSAYQVLKIWKSTLAIRLCKDFNKSHKKSINWFFVLPQGQRILF